MKSFEKIVVSISYGDYKRSLGGTDKVIGAHQKMFEDVLIGYLYLSPFKLIGNKPINDVWLARYNGKIIGCFTTNGVLGLLTSDSRFAGKVISYFVHHIINLDVARLTKVLSCYKVPVFFYVHDYYCLCPTINLINPSSGRYCGPGEITESKCGSCERFLEAKNIHRRLIDFSNAFSERLTFICPSECAKSIFVSCYPMLKNVTRVIEHQTYDLSKADSIPQKGDKLKVAYLGTKAPHKGWTLFLKLKEMFRNKYDFYYFGSSNKKNDDIVNIPVDFRNPKRQMVAMLSTKGIDICFLYSLWPETYCYTYYEAFQAGAFVVANVNGGNVADQIEKNKNGIVLESEEQVFGLFGDNSKLCELVDEYRANNHCIAINVTENDSIVRDCLKIKPVSFTCAVKKEHSLYLFALQLFYKIKVFLR